MKDARAALSVGHTPKSGNGVSGQVAKRIGLCMIVKNEAHVIERCLSSVAPICDYMLLVDTGSTDNTQAVARRYFSLNGIEGEVIDEPWRDFAYNRSFGLAWLRRRSDIDYCLTIDADEVLIYDADFDVHTFKSTLTCDRYDVFTLYGSIKYLRTQLFSNRLAYRYRGVIHEFLETPPDESSKGVAQGICTRHFHDGHRSKDPETYRRDAAVLRNAAETETAPWLAARYRFYLAQSLRDAGHLDAALESYEMRMTLGFWDEEVFCACNEVGRLRELLGRPPADVLAAYLQAYDACPRRAESLHGAARFTRLQGQFHLAYLLAKSALSIPRPEDGLFVEPWVYDYGLLDEFAVSAYWSGHWRESKLACDSLLAGGTLPVEHRERVIENLRFAEAKLRESQPDSGIPPIFKR
jgi:glycosyltransferase involved in cell wall biosynthesis